MMFIGIDPGLNGAWGMVDHHGQYIACGDFFLMDGMIDARATWNDIRVNLMRHDFEICIEAVHAMPKQGVSSTFTFGKVFGQVIAMAQMANSSVNFIVPQKWKADMGVTADKGTSLELARRLFPTAPLTRKKDNGRAEALLISEWFRRSYN